MSLFANNSLKAGRRWLAAALCCAVLGPALPAQTSLRRPIRVNAGLGPCQGPKIVAQGPEWLIVGWTVPEGPSEGVYLRWREGYLFSPEWKIEGAGAEPRDLTLAAWPGGRLLAVWTALVNEDRLVHAAWFEGGAPAGEAAPLTFDEPPASPGAVSNDFPALAVDGEAAVMIWQRSQGVRYAVHSARWEPEGGWAALGEVSGGSDSAVAPQIMSAAPLRVAWYEILDDAIGSHLRIDRWHVGEGRWRPSVEERAAGSIPVANQALWIMFDGTPAACWLENDDGAGGVVVLGRAGDSPPDDPVAVVLNDLAGDHGQPSLASGAGQTLTLAWQVIGDDGQAIQVARWDGGAKAPEVRAVSSVEERFAASPDHAAAGDWAGVVWVDDFFDGGSGDVYLSDVRW